MQTKKSASERTGSGAQPFEEFISKAEVGCRLQMRPRTVDDWMKRGLLPYYKVGHAVRFKWSEVEVHLAQTCRVVNAGAELGGRR
jgi:excisionase family DNA binding protein